MNFLAHLYLSDGSAESMVGSLWPDFVKGKSDPTLPEGVRRGIVVHRAVDRFTDTHPRFGASRSRLAPRWGRYAGILVDVLWDHVLARDWDRYAAVELESFTAHVYDTLANFIKTAPQARDEAQPGAANPGVERLHHALAVMIEQDWLTSYRDVAGIARTLSRMSDRLGHGVRLEGAADVLQPGDETGAALAADFHAFFPLLVEHARTLDSHAGAFARVPLVGGTPQTSAGDLHTVARTGLASTPDQWHP